MRRVPLCRPRSLEVEATFHEHIEDLPAEAWNALSADDNPFVDHRFLAGLEREGCIDAGNGWLPHHLAIREGDRLEIVTLVGGG